MAGLSSPEVPNSGSSKAPRWGPISDFFAGSLQPFGKDGSPEHGSEEEPEPPPQLVYPPGHMAEKILRFLLPKRDYEDIFDPALTDMRIEYLDAVSGGDEAKAKWVGIREHIRIVWLLAIYTGFATWTRQIKKLMTSISAQKGDDNNEEDE